MSLPKSIALCVCTKRAPESSQPIVDSQQRTYPVESGVLTLPFALAATVEDVTTTLWDDPIELTKHLVDFERIITFNGERFDLIVIAAEIARRLNEQLKEPQAIIDSNDFHEIHKELYKRGYDLMTISRDLVGSIFSLSNMAQSTLKYERKYTIQTVTGTASAGNPYAVANFVLEGAALVYNLHYVAQKLHKLAVQTIDDKIVVFDV